jgi:hypothetical protein
MFWFGRKKDDAVVDAVCTKLRPLFGILEHRLGGLPPDMTSDPYVLGYVVGSATIFAQIETAGKASTELRGRVSLAALQTVFASLNFSIQQASAAMQSVAGNPEAKRGSNAADLIIGVACGKTDRNNEPEIIAARKAVSAMPHAIKSALGGDENRLLMSELQEQLFFVPLESKYSKNAA